MAEYDMKQSALQYARLGLSVFPLKPKGKAPLTPHGYKDASKDPAQISSWWEQCPAANIGIATGSPSGGLLVIDLDIDEEKGVDGRETLREWERKCGKLPEETWLAITGRGGYHYFYRDPEGEKSGAGIREGVDIRGEGGYIVAPPSIHPNGRRYEWEQAPGEFPLAAADGKVNAFIHPAPKSWDKTPLNVPDQIMEGGRVNTLVKMVCSQQAKGLSDEAIRAAVRAENEAKCVPPLTDKELEKEVFPALKRYQKGTSPYYGKDFSKRSNWEAQPDHEKYREFVKIGKNGPYDIVDARIYKHIIKEQGPMMILNGVPYLYREGHYLKDDDGKVLKSRIQALIPESLVTATRVNRVYQLFLMDCQLSKKNEEVNQYPKKWINFKNGMYDVMTGTMHEHSPEYFAINQIPYKYDPAAGFSGTVAERFFKGLIPDEADRRMFFAYAGYCLTRDTGFQKFLVLTGAPGTGKSTAINTLIRMLGTENVSGLALQDLGERFASTELLGKLLNACADLPKKALEQVDMVKRITGEDQVKGEYKGGKMFWFRSYARLIFSANQMPKSYDEKTFAFFRRLLMIDIQGRGETIPNLEAGLSESMPALIKMCVDCLRDLYETGGELDSPNSKRLVHEYYRSSDSVTAFLEDCTKRELGGRIRCKELFEKYSLYCIDGQLRGLSRNSFYDDVRAKGYLRIKSQGNEFFNGLSFKKFPENLPVGGSFSPHRDFFPIDDTPENPPFT